MKVQIPVQGRLGYTLTEVILAMAVMAIAVPLILGLVVAGGESSRQAERETRAVITARSVFEEIRRALDGNSEFIAATDLPWGTLPINTAAGLSAIGGGGSISGPSDDGGGDEDWLIFELNRDGEIIGQASNMQYEDGWEGENAEVTSLAAVRGYLQEVENVEILDGVPLRVFRIEVRVETPARADAQYRQKSVFIKSDSLR